MAARQPRVCWRRAEASSFYLFLLIARARLRHNKVILHGANDAGPGPKELVWRE